MFGISDASYHQENHLIVGEMILLTNKMTLAATPIYWKLGTIRKICTSLKAAETQAMMKIIDNSMNIRKQLSIIMKEKIPLKIFMDSRPLLESLW